MPTPAPALRNLKVVGLRRSHDRSRVVIACRSLPRRPAMALLALGIGLGGCADMSDSMTTAFADPAKYDLYECKQLETERKALAGRAAELQGLMAKAETGVAGPVVAELAYRNEYISVRGQAKFAEEAWQRNKCHDTPPAAAAPAATSAPAANVKGARRRRGPAARSTRQDVLTPPLAMPGGQGAATNLSGISRSFLLTAR